MNRQRERHSGYFVYDPVTHSTIPLEQYQSLYELSRAAEYAHPLHELSLAAEQAHPLYELAEQAYWEDYSRHLG